MLFKHVHGGVRAAHQPVTLEVRVRISAVDPFIYRIIKCAEEQKMTSTKIEVYVPQNSGLQFVAEQGKAWLSDPKNVGSFTDPTFGFAEVAIRGEAVPEVIRELEESEKPVFGITGEDLLATNYNPSYLRTMFVATRDSAWRSEPLVQRLELTNKGPYQGSVFGLPALCLLGPDGLTPQQFNLFFKRGGRYDQRTNTGVIPDLYGKMIMIPTRYTRLIQAKLDPAREKEIQWIHRERSVEVTAAADASIDFAVDIVLSGRTLVEKTNANYGIYAVLFASDGVVIGNQAARRLVQTYQDEVGRRRAERERLTLIDRVSELNPNWEGSLSFSGGTVTTYPRSH